MIIDSQPLTVALLASLLFGERLGPLGFVGLGLGVLGLCLLEVPPDVLQGEPSHGLRIIVSTARALTLMLYCLSSPSLCLLEVPP